MNRGKRTDLLRSLQNFKRILENKPSIPKMVKEVQMMNFKVRPLQGDIAVLNLKNQQLLETLWSLGKLEEFFHKEVVQVPADQKELFFTMFDSLQYKLERELNTLSLKNERIAKTSTMLEMEIIKESSDRPIN